MNNLNSNFNIKKISRNVNVPKKNKIGASFRNEKSFAVSPLSFSPYENRFVPVSSPSSYKDHASSIFSSAPKKIESESAIRFRRYLLQVAKEVKEMDQEFDQEMVHNRFKNSDSDFTTDDGNVIPKGGIFEMEV